MKVAAFSFVLLYKKICVDQVNKQCFQMLFLIKFLNLVLYNQVTHGVQSCFPVGFVSKH